MLRNDLIGKDDGWFSTKEVPLELMPPDWVLTARETYAAA
jgi:hypothetical protein